MLRRVEPELLDELPADASDAIASRRDLQRVNWWMGHAGMMCKMLAGSNTPRRVVELGAGDGTLLLRLATRWPARGERIIATLVDRQNLVSDQTRGDFDALGWEVETVQADVFDWLEESSPETDLIFANLFLHHFEGQRLEVLLRQVAARTQLFLACEPRRAPCALIASRLVGLIGCTAVTRHDAVVSVRAGFAGRELSALWPAGVGWQLNERAAGMFSHRFVAARNG